MSHVTLLNESCHTYKWWQHIRCINWQTNILPKEPRTISTFQFYLSHSSVHSKDALHVYKLHTTKRAMCFTERAICFTERALHPTFSTRGFILRALFVCICYILPKYIGQKIPIFHHKSPIFCSMSHIFYQKSPIFYQKSPIFYLPRPMIHSERVLRVWLVHITQKALYSAKRALHSTKRDLYPTERALYPVFRTQGFILSALIVCVCYIPLKYPQKNPYIPQKMLYILPKEPYISMQKEPYILPSAPEDSSWGRSSWVSATCYQNICPKSLTFHQKSCILCEKSLKFHRKTPKSYLPHLSIHLEGALHVCLLYTTKNVGQKSHVFDRKSPTS